MRGLVALLSACKGRRWGTVVWAGPGYGVGIVEARALDAERYVYLEPNIELRSRLSQKQMFPERETLIGKALWSSRESRPFHVLSDPLRSSLIPPVEVLKAWPNLRKVTQYEVETESLDALVAEHGVAQDVSNLLLLDVRGAEFEILAAADESLLARFTHIVVHRGLEGATDDSGWLQLLRRQGYQSQDQGDSQARGWLLLQRPQADGVPALSIEAAHHARILELEAELERVRAENSANIDRVADEATILQSQWQDENARLRESASALENAVQDLGAALESERAAALQLQQALADARQASSLQLELQVENARLQGKVSALEGAAQELGAALDTEKTALLQSHQALADARQAARLSLKLQILRENDLRELQGRYQASLHVQERQHQMLVRLGERLGDASRYFHQLTEAPIDNPEDAASAPHVADSSTIHHEADPDPPKPMKGKFRKHDESRPPKSGTQHKHVGSRVKPHASKPGPRPDDGRAGEKTGS